MSGLTHRRPFIALLAASLFVAVAAPDVFANAKRPRFKRPKEQKAWIDGKGMCVFPFAAEGLPDNSNDFAAAMERGYRRALRLREDGRVVVAEGGTYPLVESLRIDVCDAVINPAKEKRKPSDRQLAIHGLDAARFELLGHGMSVEDSTLDLSLTASDARLLFTRDEKGKPLLVLGAARAGRMSAEMSFADVERLLLAGARKGGRIYGLSVDRTRLRMDVEGGRTVRVDLKLFTRVGFVPAGLRFRARLDIDDRLNGRLSELSCTGDEVLGPLISGLVQPFLAKYNGTTRPLMNFPRTDLRLRGVEIVSGERVRVAADFGS